MANISSLISLEAFVRRLLAKEGKDNDDYFRYKQIACDAIRDMHIHDFSVEATVVVTVNTTTNTFSYPTDFVRHIFVATVIDGRWWIYRADDTMAPLNDDDSTTIQSSLPNLADYNVFDSLGQAGGYNKYLFTRDDKNRRFQVSGYTPDIVVLRYVSNGIDSAGSINIPDHATLAIEDYVRFKIADYNGEAQSKIFRLEQQYKNSRRIMKRVYRPTLDELKDAIYLTSGALQR